MLFVSIKFYQTEEIVARTKGELCESKKDCINPDDNREPLHSFSQEARTQKFIEDSKIIHNPPTKGFYSCWFKRCLCN